MALGLLAVLAACAWSWHRQGKAQRERKRMIDRRLAPDSPAARAIQAEFGQFDPFYYKYTSEKMESQKNQAESANLSGAEAGAAGAAGEDANSDFAGGVVVCPKCKERFVAGTPFCELCGAPTIEEEDAETPPLEENRGEGGAEHGEAECEGGSAAEKERWEAPLVCIFETTDHVEAQVVRSLLESHGIRAAMRGSLAPSVHVFQGIDAAQVSLLVLEPDAERARRILESAR